MSLISEDMVELIRYCEDIVRKFYHEHYFLLVIGIIAVCMLVFLIPFGFAVRCADRELEEEQNKDKAIVTSKGTVSSRVCSYCVLPVGYFCQIFQR